MKSDDSQSRGEWIRANLERYEGPLIRYALRFTRDLDRARDVAQGTFLKLCSEDRAKVENHLAAWLFAVCRNRALDVARKEGRMNPIAESEWEVLPVETPSPSQAMERKERTGQVREAIALLPPRQQEALRLKFQEDLSYREISHIMETTVSNVGALIHAALANIRKRLNTRPIGATETGGPSS